MEIKASQVKELRERSGAGMMECKKALVDNAGDIDTAMEHLRKSGMAKADKKADRVAAEGRIVMAKDGDRAVLVEINSETDFVAKDESFAAFAQAVADAALASEDVDALLAATLAGGESVENARQALVAKIGENIKVRRMVRVTDASTVGAYVHGGRIGVIVDLEGGSEELARGIAMHVAAMNPPYLDANTVPADFVAKERDIAMAQVKDSGKPAEILEKMVAGKVKKTLAEMCLVDQPYVLDTGCTVGDALAKDKARVKQFHRLAVGEGIEKKHDDFAAEVMKQAGLG